MNFSEWLAHISGGATQVEISDHTGIPRRTIQYQISKGEKIETVIQISETYDINPLTALVSLGHVDGRWLGDLVGDEDAILMSTSEDKLAGEILRRLKEAKGKTALDTPLNELEANVLKFPATPASTPDDHDDGTVHHWDGSLDHLIAADSSPDEDALREEHGVDPID